jgi:energy-coupling factor transporter ATP-binding protein EcfA2
MINITSVEIDGFILPSQKVKLDFADSNVICIYGANGSGKTTFLEILFAVFDRNEEILNKYNVQSVNISYKLDSLEIEDNIEKYKESLKALSSKIEEKYKKLKLIKTENEYNNYKYQHIDSLEQERDKLKLDITNEIESLSALNKKITISKKSDESRKEEDNLTQHEDYYWNSLDSSEFSIVSSLFLGIGRGIHKKELSIPRETLWHFFRTHKKISEDKVLTGNEIDTLSEKLANHIMPKNKADIARREDEKVASFIKEKNIYFPNIEIDTIEQLLFNRYQKAVLDAKEQIDKALIASSMNFLNSSSHSVELDAKEFRDKLLYNKPLIIEMYGKNKESGIVDILKDIESHKQDIETLDSSKQIILFNIIENLENEVELFKEIQIFLDEYNSFLNYNKKLVMDIEGVKITPENHTLDKLSSGERHLLTFLATILLMGDTKEFILLDEPEISLDVEWIEKLFTTLSKLAPNSQIIVATHNLTILGDYYDESTEMNFESRQDV